MKQPVTLSPHHLPLHLRQLEVYLCPVRFRVLVAGRRFGKTHLALMEMFRAAMKPGTLVCYVGPDRKQAKRVAWDRLKKLTCPYWKKKPNESELRIDLTFGSTLIVMGAFSPDSIRGLGIDFAIVDECADVDFAVWHRVLRPALSDRKGKALFIGTPKGRNHFYDLYQFALSDPEWAVFQFTTAQGGLVDEAELLSAARGLDPEIFREEHEAQFTSVGIHNVYHRFDRSIHVQSVFFDALHPLIWSLDFNVNPMCMLLMQQVQDEVVNVLDEIVIKPSANTELACERFLERAMLYHKHVKFVQLPFVIKIYGDASGNHRRTSGTQTDWGIIKQFFSKWVGTFEPRFYMAASNPAVRDRVNCVNARLRNHAGENRLFIDPKCKELIRDLEQVTWALQSNGAPGDDIDKSDPNRTHTSDALGYFIAQQFNMRAQIGEKSHRLTF